MKEYEEYKDYRNLKNDRLFIEELHKLPEKFRTLPTKYTISYKDFVKYVDLAKTIYPIPDGKYTIHAYFSRYYTCKLNENGEHIICSVGVTNNKKDYELNRFDKDENYRIDFDGCSFATFITFTDLITDKKFEIGE